MDLDLDLEGIAARAGLPLADPAISAPAASGVHPDRMIEAMRLEFDRRRARASLAYFVRRAWQVLEPGTPLAWNWHHNVVCDHVQWQLEERARAVANPDYHPASQNLAVNIPPRSLKTRIITVCGTAWAWLTWPELRVRALSINPRGAFDAAYDCLRLIRSPWYQSLIDQDQAWSLSMERNAVSQFRTTAGGIRISVGFGSEIVGEGADWLIIDDPNDPDGGETQDEAVQRRYDKVIANRVNDPRTAIRTLVQQRTGESDLTGHVTARGEFVHLFVPQLFEAEIDRPLRPGERPRICRTPMPVGPDGRYTREGVTTYVDPRKTPGQLLHPARFDDAFVTAEKKRGSFYFACQHQQRPAPEEGGLFKRADFGKINREDLPILHEAVISLDANAKKTVSGSRAAYVAVARGRGPERYVLDCWAAREELPELCRQALLMIGRVREIVGPRAMIKLLVEDKALGPAVVMQLRETLKELTIPIEEVSPGDDKMSRARAASPVVESKAVLVLKGAGWGPEFEHEVCTFPNAATDDITDAFTQAINHLRTPSNVSKFLAAYG